MKIIDLINFIGIYEPIRVLDQNFDEIESAMAKDISLENLNKNIKSIYADKSVVNIIIR